MLEWTKLKDATNLEAEMVRLGFSMGSIYEILKMLDYKLRAFFKPLVAAILYHNPVVGYWVKLLVE